MIMNNETAKGYKKVTLPEYKEHIKYSEFSHLNAVKSGINGVFRLAVKTLSPICFTQNELLKDKGDGKLYYAFLKEKGKLTIAGSSLKGSVRTYCEYLSNSCVRKGSASCKANNDKSELCIVCSTFGTLGILGKIQFNDSYLQKETKFENGPVCWTGKNTDYKTGKIYSHKKKEHIISKSVYYETIPKGEEFETSISIVGLSEKELGMLFLGLGLSDKFRFAVKIGRGKNIGFGSVLMKSKSFLKLNNGFKKNDVFSNEKLHEFVQTSIDKYLSTLDKKSVIFDNLKLLVDDSHEVINSA